MHADNLCACMLEAFTIMTAPTHHTPNVPKILCLPRRQGTIANLQGVSQCFRFSKLKSRRGRNRPNIAYLLWDFVGHLEVKLRAGSNYSNLAYFWRANQASNVEEEGVIPT